MTDYIKKREANLKHYSKEITERFDKDISYRSMLKGACKSILTFDSPNQPPNTPEYVGDYEKPNFGIDENTFYPRLNSSEMSTLFKSHSKPLKILDFACGGGLLDLYLAPYLPKNSEIIGVDISPNQLDLFGDRILEINEKNPHLKVTLSEFDILNNDYNEANNLKAPELLKPGMFDIIFTTASYHHFDSVTNITKKLKDYLKVGGTLIILDMYDGKSKAIPDQTNNGPQTYFSPQVLKEFLSGFNFSNLKTGISYKYQQCFKEVDIKSYLSESKFESMFGDAPTRVVNGTKECIFLGEMVIAVCTK